ncbi:DUF5955 family protein [Streptomyces sp. NBC_01317]|uniref:DUF5955 family protein n=1 Tax=Streptomyces sp. NBC_01317 TaxID=2903822 RepID=UPI003FA37381|nr:DUF5955 family protein [Streptomyces sp. NBC_01317]
MLRSVGQPRVTESYGRGERHEDPGVLELRAAVSRLRRELAAYPAEFRDRAIAEDELSALATMAANGAPEVPRMRRSLLLIVGSIGSVSALTSPLLAVRAAVDVFGNVPRPR